MEEITKEDIERIREKLSESIAVLEAIINSNILSKYSKPVVHLLYDSDKHIIYGCFSSREKAEKYNVGGTVAILDIPVL